MRFVFVHNVHWGLKSLAVTVPTGTGRVPTLGAEAGDGNLALVSGSVEVFSGP
jgi:hypothetical protein